MLGQNDARDHRIPEFPWTAFLMPGCHQVTCVLRGGNIKGNNSMADLVENSIECRKRCHQHLRLARSQSAFRVCRIVETNVTMNPCPKKLLRH
jgi:hypothetical protein